MISDDIKDEALWIKEMIEAVNSVMADRAELKQRREEELKTCVWKFESDEFVQPACKPNAFLKYDTSLRAGFKFCPYCGHRIEEAKP